MTYNDTLDWLFTQLPMYQRQGKAALKNDLSNTLKLAEYLGFPERNFRSIHVAGTNGKGSTSHMLASVLQEAGFKVGLYTSPHLKDFRERIKINGEDVSESFVVSFIEKNKTFFESNMLSFFEMTVGMAFDYFSKESVDIAVIEVGLGGRLDSTNIIKPELSIITNIGLDHTAFLGETLEKIAYEKGGIIKENVPVVISETQDETAPIFIELAKSKDAEISFADQKVVEVFTTDLKGDYQIKNVKGVVLAIEILNEIGLDVSQEVLKLGLNKVIENTKLLGRWQTIGEKPKVVCDTGHNREGLTYVMKQLSKQVFDRLHIVFGVVNDKDLTSIVDLLPKNARYYYCKPDIPRGMDSDVLKRVLNGHGLEGESYISVNEAYKEALKSAGIRDFIFIGGSTFVVSEII